MKIYFFFILLFGLAFTPLCSASIKPNNLVENGDFEAGSKRWRGDADIIYETSSKTNRICSIKVDPDKKVSFFQKINISNLKKVSIKFRVKKSADYVAENGSVLTVFVGSRGRGKFLRNNDWNEVEWTIDNWDEEDWVDLSFVVKPGQSGTVSFDDIEVVEYVEPTKDVPPVTPDESFEDEYRTFTDKNGRQINAKIVGSNLDGTKVTVQKEGSHTSTTVPVTLFDDDTQAYIRSWMTISDLLNERIFIVEFNHEHEIIADKSESGVRAAKGESKKDIFYGHHIEIILQNKSTHPFNNVMLEYTLFYEQDHDGTLYDKESIDVPPLSTKVIATKQIILRSYEYSSSLMGVNRDGALQGIIVHLSVQTDTGRVVTREIVYPEKRDLRWTTKTINSQAQVHDLK